MANLIDRAIAYIGILQGEVKELTDSNYRLESENRVCREKVMTLEKSCVELDAILKAAEPSTVASTSPQIQTPSV